MLKKILLLSFIFIFSINHSIANEVQNYKINFELDSMLLKGRDIKETDDFVLKNNIEFNFKNYSENNSFLEITLRTSRKESEYFSLQSIMNLISNKRIDYMNNLSADKISDIHTFLDQKSRRVFFYRSFANKKLENEKCVIFVAGVKKNINNLHLQVLNGVGCSTEIKLTHKNIGRIFSLIKITKN